MTFLRYFLISITATVFAVSGVFGQQQQQLPREPQQQQQQLQQQPQQQPQAHQDVPSPDEISDDELKNFVEASQKIDPIQQNASKEIEAIVEGEDMELHRFQQLMAANQNPELAAHVQIEQEEMQQIQNMQPEIANVQENLKADMIQAVIDCGLSIERFQEIYLSLQQHPELVERLEELLAVDVNSR